jgi:hypothetical protein
LGDIGVLDVVREETALEAKRRELAHKIAEGRQVVASLAERRDAIGRKIEEAVEGVQRLQDQLKAIDTVISLVDPCDIAFQPSRPVMPVLEVVEAMNREPQPPLRPQPFRPAAYLKCFADGHDWMNSRSVPGAVTCRRCKARRKG